MNTYTFTDSIVLFYAGDTLKDLLKLSKTVHNTHNNRVSSINDFYLRL